MVDYEVGRVLRDELPLIRRALEQIVLMMEEESAYRKAFGAPHKDPYNDERR